jgi:hypothetical protein
MSGDFWTQMNALSPWGPLGGGSAGNTGSLMGMGPQGIGNQQQMGMGGQNPMQGMMQMMMMMMMMIQQVMQQGQQPQQNQQQQQHHHHHHHEPPPQDQNQAQNLGQMYQGGATASAVAGPGFAAASASAGPGGSAAAAASSGGQSVTNVNGHQQYGQHGQLDQAQDMKGQLEMYLGMGFRQTYT